MKNKLALTLLFTLVSFLSFSQIVTFELNNPFPRIGNEFLIEYTIKKDTNEVNDSKNFLEQAKEIRSKILGSGTLKLTNMIKDTGYSTIGPFEFNINNQVVRSEQIKLKFDDPLPKEKRGIWIRQSIYNGQEYLIIEQRISGEWVTTKTSSNSISREFKSDSEDFVEINQEKFENANVTFSFSYSTSGSQEVDINGESITVSYKMSLYKINKSKLFKAPLKLNKTNLKFLPQYLKDFEFVIK